MRTFHKYSLFFASAAALASISFSSPAFAQPVTLDREQLKQLIRETVREELQSQQRTQPAVEAPKQPAAPIADEKAVEKLVERKIDDRVSELQSPDSVRTVKAGAFDLSFEGYGDIQFAHHDYSENGLPQENSRGASRTEFDSTRFAFEIEAQHLPSGLQFEAEMEYEHGGTGASTELDYDEFGEFENEVEKGGEVELEELYVKKEFDDGWSARVGRILVNVGLLSDYHRPTDYLASTRPDTETIIIPGVWNEVGFDVQKQFEFGRATAQLVNGLDSTGFSAADWVAGGKQDRFEANRAQDVAGVLRFDYTGVPALLVGTSAYYGGSTNNRPKADLDADGNVFIGDVHARYWGTNLRTQGALIWGHLSDADAISQRNSRLSNQLGVPRTPVADEALGLWTEVGYNIAPALSISEEHRLDPYLRFEYYDTYFDTRDNLADNDRYERYVYTGGLAYTYDSFLVTKLDYSIRSFGQGELSDQNTLRFEVGFVY
jgi:hypothetical protein